MQKRMSNRIITGERINRDGQCARAIMRCGWKKTDILHASTALAIKRRQIVRQYKCKRFKNEPSSAGVPSSRLMLSKISKYENKLSNFK